MLCFFALDYKTNKGNSREREREREWKRVVCFGHKAQAFLFLAISTRFGTIDEPPNFHANIIIQTLKRHACVRHLFWSFQVFWCYRNRERAGIIVFDFVSECLKMLLGVCFFFVCVFRVC
jgi:hypothetical protein